ncbi:uncharacterized protein BDR25DRAFT_119663 [Lindgomyces ingoldianus]|uniref:Uncharacterized protein n=1 Tax=Lindgomyces ingoldianus TaxID=673940 RepID=A0ACB6R516_9PLEO|nr:uncharacterized protein BDR25DRAFT_119663 [Lindgomyces ingoldianus]KAF2474167.1 hypothetical protein BDR25DRAFT_119663 [Lindgomyces ingoldianus]
MNWPDPNSPVKLHFAQTAPFKRPAYSRRPTLKSIVSAPPVLPSSTPTALPATPSTQTCPLAAHRPYLPSQPTYHRRPTLRDIVFNSTPPSSPLPNQESLPLPPLPPHPPVAPRNFSRETGASSTSSSLSRGTSNGKSSTQLASAAFYFLTGPLPLFWQLC